MCIILDVNCFTEFKNENDQNMAPVRKWFNQENSKIAYAPTQQFREEWEQVSDAKRRQLKTWSRAGKLKMESKKKVENEIQNVKDRIKSDDPHIIALARVAKVKVLVSHDQDLHRDFTNPQLVGGKVYQTEAHSHLLVRDMCP